MRATCLITFILLLGLVCQGFAGTIAITGGSLFTITQGVIEGGTLLIEDDRITGIGEVTIPTDTEIIDATGMVIMPGLIDGFTNLGTAELESFGPDHDETTTPMTPHLRVIDALNPDNRFIRAARRTGITLVLSAPGEGNLLSGQSAVIQLAGTRMEDMVIRFPAAIHATFGEGPKARYGVNNQMPMTRMGIAAMMRQSLIEAMEHAEKFESYEQKLLEYESGDKEDSDKPTSPARDLKNEALIPVVRGELPLIISADRYDDILTALRIAEEFDLRIILIHGSDSYRVAEKLAEENIPVIIGPSVSRDPRQETMKAVPDLAVRLHDAGVKIAFQTGSIANVRGLLAEARYAVQHGLPAMEAIKALTLNPATIFSIDEDYGSLEVGKKATFTIFDDDPISQLARVQTVFIDGKKIKNK